MLLYQFKIHRDWRPDSMYHDLFSDFDFPLPENFNDDYEGRLGESKYDGNWDTSKQKRHETNTSAS